MENLKLLDKSNGLLDILVNDDLIIDLAELEHILIIGSCGSGKSVFLNNILCSLIYKHSLDTLLIVLDSKTVEFYDYNGVNSLYNKRVYNDEFLGVFEYLKSELLRRKSLDKKTLNKEKKIVLVCDEFADIFVQDTNNLDALLINIIKEGKELGIHLVLSVQNYLFVSNSGFYKFIPTKIAFRLVYSKAYNEFLETNQDVLLKDKGEMIIKNNNHLVKVNVKMFDYDKINDFLLKYKG